jgi:hypothetical protein
LIDSGASIMAMCGLLGIAGGEVWANQGVVGKDARSASCALANRPDLLFDS